MQRYAYKIAHNSRGINEKKGKTNTLPCDVKYLNLWIHNEVCVHQVLVKIKTILKMNNLNMTTAMEWKENKQQRERNDKWLQLR